MASKTNEKLKMKNEKRLFDGIVMKKFNNLSYLIFFTFLFSLFSCKSTPPMQFASLLEETHLPLDTGAAVYLAANMKQARPVIDLLPIKELQDKQTAQMMDRTDFITAALFPRESGRYFQLAAWGNYPNSRAGMALGSNKEWEKQTAESGDTYWYSQRAKLSMAIEARQAFAVSSYVSQPVDPRAKKPGIEIPKDFSDFAKGAQSNTPASPLSLWMDNPAPLVARLINTLGVQMNFPVQQIFINIYSIENASKNNEFDSVIRLIFANQTQARGAVNIFNLAFALVPRDMPLASIFFANTPVLNGNFVDIKTGMLSEKELGVLLEMIF